VRIAGADGGGEGEGGSLDLGDMNTVVVLRDGPESAHALYK
jgi:hypothetical protein